MASLGIDFEHMAPHDGEHEELREGHRLSCGVETPHNLLLLHIHDPVPQQEAELSKRGFVCALLGCVPLLKVPEARLELAHFLFTRFMTCSIAHSDDRIVR